MKETLVGAVGFRVAQPNLQILALDKPHPQIDSLAKLMRNALRYPQIEPYVGEFEGRRSASQRGVWGSEPPDPGSVLTRENRHSQVLFVYRSA